MSWHLLYLRFKQLSKELIAAQTELDMTTEIVKSVSKDFLEYQNSWSKKNNKDLAPQTEQQHLQITDKIKERDISTSKKKQLSKTSKKSSKIFSRIYKLIAKKIHPDKFASLPETQEIRNKKEMYKRVTNGMSFSKWSEVLDVALELAIKPSNLVEVNQQIQVEIKNLKELVSVAKSTYGWKFYECQDDYECKDRVLRSCVESFYE